MGDFVKEFEEMAGGLGIHFDKSVEDGNSKDAGDDVIEDNDENTGDDGDVENDNADIEDDNENVSDESESKSQTDDKYDALLTKIQELEAKLADKSTGGEDKKDDFTPESAALDEIDYFDGVSFDDLIEDEGKFKDWFKDSLKKTREADQKSFMTAVYQALPKIISTYVHEQVNATQSANAFYEQNPDLADYKQKVVEAANTIAHIKPNLSREDFYKEVASLTRYQLGLKEKATKRDKKPALNNKSVKAKSLRTPPKELEGFDKAVDEMMTAIKGGR